MFTQVGVKQLTDFLRTVTAASDLVVCTLVNCGCYSVYMLIIFHTIPKEGLCFTTSNVWSASYIHILTYFSEFQYSLPHVELHLQSVTPIN